MATISSLREHLDLLLIDPWRSDDAEEAESPPEPREAPPARRRNPAVMVALLAAAALLVFALGEPIVLEAAPQTGPKALAAVMVFLFSTGIVLAAGSALDALRRTEGEGAEQERGYQETRSAVQTGPRDPGKVSNLREDEGDPLGESSLWGTLGIDDARRVIRAPGMPAPADLSGWLALLILLLAALGLWKLLVRRWRHRTRRKNPGGLLSRRWRGDPLAGLDDLLEHPSRDAVLAAYHRFLMLLECLGHTRPARATPYETLQGLPPHLQPLASPARTLTDLYVLAAYAAEPVERGDGERAIGVLREMRGLVERPG